MWLSGTNWIEKRLLPNIDTARHIELAFYFVREMLVSYDKDDWNDARHMGFAADALIERLPYDELPRLVRMLRNYGLWEHYLEVMDQVFVDFPKRTLTVLRPR